jgi:hypothetical protein
MCYETPSICQTNLKIHTLLRNRPSQCPLLVITHDVLEKSIANGVLNDVAFVQVFLFLLFRTVSGARRNVI